MAFATPEWVRRAGAKGYFYQFGKGRVEKKRHLGPGFWRPPFSWRNLRNFSPQWPPVTMAIPTSHVIDVGSFGLWGEGHTFMSSRVPDEEAPAIVRKHIDLHVKYFPRTLLCISDDVAGHDKPGRHLPETDYALSKGVTLRDDSILVQPPPPLVVPRRDGPGILAALAGDSRTRTLWRLQAARRVGRRLAAAQSGGGLPRQLYVDPTGGPRELLNENRPLIERINRRLGYRLQLREISWPSAVALDRPFTVRSLWSNAGVAPCYPGGFMALTLKDDQGGLVSVLVDEKLDMRQLTTGPADQIPTKPLVSEFVIGHVAPVVRTNTYTVYVSVGMRDGTPRLALPLAGDDGQHRYKLGAITLRAP